MKKKALSKNYHSFFLCRYFEHKTNIKLTCNGYYLLEKLQRLSNINHYILV